MRPPECGLTSSICASFRNKNGGGKSFGKSGGKSSAFGSLSADGLSSSSGSQEWQERSQPQGTTRSLEWTTVVPFLLAPGIVHWAVSRRPSPSFRLIGQGAIRYIVRTLYYYRILLPTSEQDKENGET
jgi:hypothetical protein